MARNTKTQIVYRRVELSVLFVIFPISLFDADANQRSQSTGVDSGRSWCFSTEAGAGPGGYFRLELDPE